MTRTNVKPPEVIEATIALVIEAAQKMAPNAATVAEIQAIEARMQEAGETPSYRLEAHLGGLLDALQHGHWPVTE